MNTIDLSMVSGYVPGVTDPVDMVPFERTNTLQDAFAWTERQQQRKAANDRLRRLSDYALLGHNADWDAEHADLKNDSTLSHLTMEELNADDRDLLLGSELADTIAKGDTWGAAERMAEMLPAEQREAYLTELRGCEKETDMFRLMGRRFRADTRGAFDRQQAWAKQNAELAQRWAAGDDYDDTFSAQAVDAMIAPMRDSDYDNMTRVREFMRERIRPLENLDDFEEAMHRLDGMEDELLALIGDDEGSTDRADMVTQALMGWAQKMAKTNRANEWNEIEVAVGKTLSNWMRAQETPTLGYMSAGYLPPVGNPDMPVMVPVSRETQEWAKTQLDPVLRYRKDKARGVLRMAVDEAMKADESLHWTRRMTRGAASMFGETAPYLLPGGMYIGTANVVVGGTYEQYTKNLAQDMEPGEALVNSFENSAINATVEALPWNRAISRIGGTGLNATFGRFLSEDIKKGIKPGWLTRRVAAWSSKGLGHALVAETVGSFVDEGVLEPIAQGFLQYGADHALDALGVKHGETKGFWDDFDELRQTWTDPTQLGALLLFSAAMTGAYTPAIKKQVEVFANNRNFWMTQGLTEKQAEAAVLSENPLEEGRKMVDAEWKKDPDSMRQRRLDANKNLAAQGGVLVLTGVGDGDPDLNPGGMVNRAAAAVWNDYVERGIVPKVERVAEGKVKLTKKDGSVLEMSDASADVYLLEQLHLANIDETRKLQEQTGRRDVGVNLRQQIADHLSKIAGSAALRAVEEQSGRTGIEFDDVLEAVPEHIREKIKAAGAVTYAIAKEISQYAMQQIDELVHGGRATETEARNMVGQMGRMRSLGSWANFANDFANRAKVGNIALTSARTTINGNRTGKRVKLDDGRTVMGQVLMGVRGSVNHYGVLEDVTERFVDQMLDERAQALMQENEGMTYAEAGRRSLKELHSIVKVARDATAKADPSARLESVGAEPNHMEVVEALSTLALSQFAVSDAVPSWMRGLSHALAANLQMAADIDMVKAAYANALKTSPDALAKMEQLLDELGVQVRDTMREAQITEADIAAWKSSVAVAESTANGPTGSGGASVSNVVADAEKEEQGIRDREKEKPVAESEPATGKDLQTEFEKSAAPIPEEDVPTRMRGVFTGGCVYNAAGGYFVGMVDKTKLRDGTEQVKKGAKGKHGVIAGRELTGNFQASAAPLIIWQRTNGELWVISGRHRFELMMRDESCASHLCYVYEEDATHDAKWARLMDYEANMRDDQADELTAATYVRETGYSDETLRQKGLMRNESRSKRGALIGRYARQELWDRFSNGAVDAKNAEIICNLTKNIRDDGRVEEIQRRCCQLLEQKKSWEYIGGMVQLMANKEAVVMRQGLLDFGADFEADLNRAATWIEKNLAKINEALTLLKQGRKMSEKKREEAERLGISVATTEGTQQMLQLLNDLKAKFEFIGSYPDMVAQATLYDGKSEVDPVGQLLEQAQRDRAEMAEENAMSDDALLEKRNREIAAQSVPSLFEMQGGRSDAEISQFPGENEESYAERVSIMNSAKADGTWLKAPNGEPSKLNPQQWTQVRTFSFLRWFGDWLKKDRLEHALEALRHMPVIKELTGEEFQKDGEKLSVKVVRYWEEQYDGKVYRDILGDVKLDLRAVKDSMSHGIGSLKSAAFAAVADVIKSGVFVEFEPNWKGRGKDSYVFAAPVQIGKEQYICEAIVLKNDDRTGFYLHEVQIKKEPRGEIKTGLYTGSPVAPKAIIGDIIRRVKENKYASAILDENGEPRVVYHGTATDGLSVFAHKKAQDKTGRRYAMGWGKGKFYLTTSEMGALNAASGAAARGEGSTPQAMPLFVSMRNPITADEYNARYKALSGHELNEPYADGYGMKERDRFIKALDKSLSNEKIGGIVDDVSGALAVFKPNQMKSATQNNGGFSLVNDNIMFSMEGEMEALKDASIADGTFMTAPNGKPTNLTERQWLQVRTKSFKKWFGDWENDPENASKVLDENGEPRVMYHETSADFTVFDTKRAGGAGEFDSAMPHGIFLKPTADGIGLSGDRQMQLFARIERPLDFENRVEMERYWRDNVSTYQELYNEKSAVDKEYAERFKQVEDEHRDLLLKLRRRKAAGEIDSTIFQQEAGKHEENVVEPVLNEWSAAVDEVSAKMRDVLDNWIENSDYDGIILNHDVGSFGRVVKTYLVLHPNQVKSATDNRGTFDGENADITFSMDFSPAGMRAVNLDDYFLPLQEGEQDMPIGLLRLMKKEPRQSIENAKRFMAMAARGETRKRAAVAVVQNADGTYTIVDGNATSRALAEMGADSVRVSVVGPDTGSLLYNSAYLVKESRDGVDADGEMRTHGLEGLRGESALNRAFEQAKENIAPLQEIVEAAAKEVGGEAMMRPANDENNMATKKPSTARDKANRDYKGDISRVVDLIGGTCVMPSNGDFYDALKAIRKALPEGASIAKVKKLGFKTMAPMYRDIKVSVRFANGGIGEIILVEGFINDAKFNRGGHNIYDVTRELAPYENESAVETALKELDALSSLVYQRGVSAETLERAKALASSALEALQPSLKNFALSSGVIGSIKSPDSLSKHIKPASVLSAATPRVSLIQYISTDNISASDGGVNNNLQGPMTFSMERNLAAAHTLSLDKFLAVAKLGGMPVPSIAITRLDKPYIWGGDEAITLIGVPRLGQPGPGNRVYFHDAYTGTMPRFFYKRKNEKRLEKLLEGKIKPALKPYGMEDLTNLRNTLFRDGNEERAIDESDADIAQNGALAAYWAITEKGYKPKPKTKLVQNNFAAGLWGSFDAATKRKVRAWHKQLKGDITNEDVRAFCAILRTWFSEHPSPSKAVQQAREKRFADAENYLSDSAHYAAVNEALSWQAAIDRGDTDAKAQKAIDFIENISVFNAFVGKHRAEFEAWAKKMKADFVGAPVFKTHRQRTNWRGEVIEDWWEMVPATLMNLTRHLRDEKKRGEEYGSMSPGLFLAYMSDEMTSKRDVSANRERLIATDDFNALVEDYKERYWSFVEAVNAAKTNTNYYNDQGDVTLYRLAELKEKGVPLTDEAIAAVIRSNTGVKWTDEMVQQGVELMKMALALPSDYMEAIPMRAVKLDEFRYAIMPESLRDNAEVNAVIENSYMEPIYHDGTREGYEKAMASLIGTHVAFQMTETAKGAMDILRGREAEVEGTRLINAWQEMVDAWDGKDLNKLGGGYRAMAELRGLIAATRAVLPEKYTRMGSLRFTLQWAEVYSTMADEGKVPMSGTITNPIFEQVRQRMAEQDELNRLNGLTDEEAADVLRNIGGMRMEHLMRRVAIDCRSRLERWLKDKERQRIETMIERMYPKREAGRKSPRGKVDADTYRYVEEARSLFDMEVNDVADIIDANKALLAALKPDEADYEKRREEYEHKIYMASVYGNWDGKSLDDARRAVTELVELMTAGRLAWKEKLDAERAHTKWLVKSITRNFAVKAEQAQAVGADKQMAEGAKRLKQLKSVFKGTMSFAQLMIALRPVLGKQFCDRQRRMLAEHHKNTMKFNNDLRSWMFDTLHRVTGLKTEDEMQVWLNGLNQQEHTGIRRVLKVKHSVALTIEDARRWVAMSKEERDAERKRLTEENEEKEQLDTNIPTEGHIEGLRDALNRYDENMRLASMSEEERAAVWQKESEGKNAEWKKKNNPGLRVAQARRQQYVKAETETEMEQDEIVATKEGILYTLLLLEQDDYAHLAEPNGLTDESIIRLRDYIGTDVMEWGHAMRDKLIEQGKDMRTFYEEYTGVPLGSNPRYFPGAFEMEANKSNKEAPDQQGGAGGGITGGKMGCLIARRKHNRKFDWLLSASAMFRNAMQQQYNYISVTPITREWRALLNDAEFSRRLRSEIGPDMVRQLSAWIETLEGAVAQDAVIGNQMSRLQRSIIQMYAISRLAGNVYTWMKQSSGIIHGFLGGYVPDAVLKSGKLNERMTYHHIGFGEYIGSMGKCLARQNAITMKDIKDSDYIKQRISDKGRYLESTILMKPTTKIANKAGRWAKENITDRSMDVMENIDRNSNAAAMLYLANAIYDRAAAENVDGLVPDDALRQMAIETAGMMLDIAAQPKVRTQKSLWGVGGGFGGAVGDFLMLFKSESLSKLGLAMAQCMGGEKGYALTGYATFGIFNAFVLWAINWVKGQWGTGDDDKSKLEWWQKLGKFGFNAATGDLSAVPIIGDSVGMAESMLFGGWNPSGSNLAEMYVPFGKLYTASAREWKAVNKGKDGWDRHFQNVTNIIREAASCGAFLPGVNSTCVTMSELLAAAATAANIGRTGKDVVKKTLELAQ